MSVVAYYYVWLEISKFCPKIWKIKKTPSIQVSGYMGLHTWILILSNYPMFGYMDSWISQFVMYPDTWIHGYLDIMDTWIHGYLDISTFLKSG